MSADNRLARTDCDPTAATDLVSATTVSPPDVPSVTASPPPAVGGDADGVEPPIRVMALHALLYCERLFYLEEVEEIRVADGAVYAGRRLHDDVVPLDDETPEHRSVELGSTAWGIFGKADAVRRRDGRWVAYEHKRGRCRRDDDNGPQAWPSDRIQAIAYAVLLEEALGEPVSQARIRYHADNVTAFVEIDEEARDDLRRAVQRARELRRTSQRPSVTNNENLCRRCSLAPVCLPEEERLAAAVESEASTPPRLFPSDRRKQTLHLVSARTRLGRSGETLVVTTDEGTEKVPINDIDSVLVHGYAQVTTQAIHLCASHDVSLSWLTGGGRFAAGTAASAGRVQQRLRQYQALVDDELRLRLARQLVHAKVETQLRYLLRATRGDQAARNESRAEIERIREALKRITTAASSATLLGLEGTAAKAYFACLPRLLGDQAAEELRPTGRSKHPPGDRFNAALSFGYAMVQSLVMRSILAVGLEPAFGFYHQPRTAAHPLVLDVMELYRTPLWEMPLIGSINRGQWQPDDDFSVTRQQVWLSESGRKKALQLFEQRLQESYRHPYTGQSLTYARLVELEVRLLEKEWSGCPGVFAQMRLR
jgi:CRISPR-associated protein Cas1